MNHLDKSGSSDPGFDRLDTKIHQVLKNEGASIPTTVEEVLSAKARLKARPVTLPPHLRDSSLIIKKHEAQEIANNTNAIIPHITVRGNANEKAKLSPGAPKEFVEAIVIAQFTRLIASPAYPLGHLRQNKLVYFAHRKADENVEAFFSKQPAGPYSPRSKYQGPEKIAQDQGYIKKATVGNYVGFVVGDKIEQIDQYLSRYPISTAIDWVVKEFRFRNKEQLELLATVDFAALEILKSKKAVTMANVKHVIATSKKWTAKLNRELFSDVSIERALQELKILFPTTYT